MTTPAPRAIPASAFGLILVAIVLLNANGREIGSYDTQPTKFAAIELATHGTLMLDDVVRRVPAYAERPGFARTEDGHYRSAYPALPSIAAAGLAFALDGAGLVDLDARLAPAFTAKLTTSLFVALAVLCAYLVAAQRTSAGRAWLVAFAYGFGTNVWLAGQALGGDEMAVFGLTAALVFIARPGQPPAGWRAWLAAFMLAVAGAARPQVAAAVAVLAAYLLFSHRQPRQWLAMLPIVGGAAAVAGFNLAWFGHLLGAVPELEALHPVVHATTGSWSNPIYGMLGLLASPSRGLLVFSPVVLVCLASPRAVAREGWHGPLAWCATAFLAQITLYSCYSVWWGGHTFGPRYAIDALPPLLPIAAEAVNRIAVSRSRRILALLALGWSVCVAATGVLSYPAERWNTDPANVDVAHARLWDWRDPQFVRCWRTGLSPQNLNLFRREIFRRPPVR